MQSCKYLVAARWSPQYLAFSEKRKEHVNAFFGIVRAKIHTTRPVYKQAPVGQRTVKKHLGLWEEESRFNTGGKIESDSMDGLNQWHAHPDPEDEPAYMYQRQEEYAMMQGMQQQYTLPPAMVPPPIAGPSSSRPPHPRHSSTSFRGGFGVPPALPSLPFGEVAVKNDPGQPSSSSHRILSFGGQLPGTIDISGGDWPDGIEAALQLPAPERRSRAHFWNTQKQHVVAERKRREKMQQQFVALATIVPDLTKTDKISLLGSTIEYVKQLEEKVKTLKGQSARRRMSKPTVFESKYRISTDGSDTPGSSESAFSAGGFSPTVEARIHGDTVLLRIWCKDRKGVLVMLISELEKQGLSIINTSVLPFTDSCLNITITAKIGERFSTTVELVTKLTTALRGFST